MLATFQPAHAMERKTYFKLATWDARALTFKDGKRGYASEAAAVADATKPGRYRVSTVAPTGRTDGTPFIVEGTAAPAKRTGPARGGLRDKPGPWNMRGSSG